MITFRDVPWTGPHYEKLGFEALTALTPKLHAALREDNGKTRLTLTHTGFPTSSHRDVAAGGWPGFLDRIDSLLA